MLCVERMNSILVLKVCSMRLENLGEVNSSCKEKLGELEVCKSEIGRLADVVEKRFSQVEDEMCLEIHICAGEGGERGGAKAKKPSSSLGGEHTGGENDVRSPQMKVVMTS